jgi:hypothetical protein
MAKVFVDVGLEAILNNTNCMVEGKVKNKRQLPSCSNYPEYIGDDASVSSSASRPVSKAVLSRSGPVSVGRRSPQGSRSRPRGKSREVEIMFNTNSDDESVGSLMSLNSLNSQDYSKGYTIRSASPENNQLSVNTARDDTSSVVSQSQSVLSNTFQRFMQYQGGKTGPVGGYSAINSKGFSQLSKIILSDPDSRKELFDCIDFKEVLMLNLLVKLD